MEHWKKTNFSFSK